MNSTTTLSIGEVADASGVSVSAIRYYDEIGLVAPVGRDGGKRRFEPASVGRLRFIRRAKAAGFCLDDVRRLLNDDANEWHDLVSTHITSLRRQRDQLDLLITLLEEVQRCGCAVVAECPRIEEQT